MKRNLQLLLTGIFFSFAFCTRAQYSYSIDQTIPVEVNGKSLSLPWAGGINSAQLNTLDVDGDGQQDLVIFERTANKILTYLAKNKAYKYAPEYETFFPPDVSQWLLLRDFNGDGKKDVFTSDPFGMKVYVNTTKAGKKLSWRAYNQGLPLLTIGFSGNINLQVNSSDIPAIDDIDGDGDLDILVARFASVAGALECHKNFSIENAGRIDSLQFKRVTQNWGNFEECSCGQFVFGSFTSCPTGGRVEHAGGKSLLTLDVDNDGDKELLFSEENCTKLYLLNNQGTKDEANMNSSFSFPKVSTVNFDVFPAGFYEDVTFDGVPDLIASSNIGSRTTFATTFNKTMWLYKNAGTNQLPEFTFVKDNFLQDDMIDIGDNSVPAFFDVDGDSDLDMIIGSYGNEPNTSFTFFENVGTIADPSFKFITADFLDFSSGNKGLYNYKPQFADMDADGKIDFVFTATKATDGLTTLYFLQNKKTTSLDVQGQPLMSTLRTIEFNENILVTDVNQDGLADLLIGTATGAIEYWINNGPKESFSYSLKSASYLGLGTSTDRQNLALSVGDLNNDGKEELITGNQRGIVTIYDNYRGQQAPAQGITQLVVDPITAVLIEKKLNGRIWPVAANLFFKKYPSLIIGNILGGITVLKNEDLIELPTEVEVSLYPNPVSAIETLTIRANRNMSVQFTTMLGQNISDTISIRANQSYPFSVENLAAGLYIATFTSTDQKVYKKFIVH